MQTNPNVLSLRPSWSLAGLLLALHGMALACLVPLEIALWIKLAIVAALAAGLVPALYGTALLRSADAVVELELRDDGSLQIARRDGTRFDAEVLAATAVYAPAVLLRVKAAAGGRSRSIVVFPDTLPAQDLRRLRVWLRWRAQVSGA